MFYFNKIPVKLTNKENTHFKRKPPKDRAYVNSHTVFKCALPQKYLIHLLKKSENTKPENKGCYGDDRGLNPY